MSSHQARTGTDTATAPRDGGKVRRHRARERAGRAVLPVEVHLQALSAALIEGGFLAERDADDRGAVAKAAGRVLDLLAATSETGF